MVIATFGPTTGWVGKTITYDEGRFTLEGHGPVTAQGVVEYDRSGHLQWAYDGLREWVYQTAGLPAPPPVAPAAEPPAVEPPPAVASPPPAAEPPAEAPPVVSPAAPAAPPPAGAGVTAVQPPPHVAAPQPGVAPPYAGAPPHAGAPQYAAAPEAAAAAPPSQPGARPGWVLPLVIVVALGVLSAIAFALASGRLRDAAGMVATAAAVIAAAVFIGAALTPDAARRWIPAMGQRATLVVSGVFCGVLLLAAAGLWWMPHYEVLVPTDTRIVLDESPEMRVRVVNHGLFGGTFSAPYSVDGAGQSQVSVRLGPGESTGLDLELPSSAAPGVTTLVVGGFEITARAVRPPEYHVAELQITPAIAKIGQTVAVETSVDNSGDISGTFPGVLEADGSELDAQPVEVGPGAVEPLSYAFTPGSAGDYRLRCGDAEATLVVVKPVRLRNGYVIARKIDDGRAKLTIKNKSGRDAMVVLARSIAPQRPVFSVYMRKNGSTVIRNIPDGKFVVWDCTGTDWNWYTGDFLTPVEYRRWVDPLVFSTRASTRYWTTAWSDAAYIYTQRHSKTTTNWSNWTLTIGTGASKYTKVVSASAFPEM